MRKIKVEDLDDSNGIPLEETNKEDLELFHNIIKEKYFDIHENFLISPEILIKDNYILTPTVLLKKNIISGKKFEETEYRNLCEDYYLWITK